MEPAEVAEANSPVSSRFGALATQLVECYNAWREDIVVVNSLAWSNAKDALYKICRDAGFESDLLDRCVLGQLLYFCIGMMRADKHVARSVIAAFYPLLRNQQVVMQSPEIRECTINNQRYVVDQELSDAERAEYEKDPNVTLVTSEADLPVKLNSKSGQLEIKFIV